MDLIPFYNRRKTKHRGPCKHRFGVCFNYDQMGHLVRDCIKALMAFINQAVQTSTLDKPLIGQGVGSKQGGKGRKTMRSQVRVCALKCQEAQTLNNVVTSTLLAENLIAKVLFNPGATYSFILANLASRIRKPWKELVSKLIVSTPIGKLLHTNEELNKCKIKIGENIIESDLVILNLNDFDIILGMDWLSKHHASTDFP